MNCDVRVAVHVVGILNSLITEQSTTSYVLTVLEHSHIQSDVIACTVL